MIPEGFRGPSWNQFRARASEWSQRASEGPPGTSSAPGPAKVPRGPQRGLLGPYRAQLVRLNSFNVCRVILRCTWKDRMVAI
eukprot:10110035-Karenia_brevis.AAC.2